ncbi:hypothetical protein N2152v2_001013 [Parachlorella kessleri]
MRLRSLVKGGVLVLGVAGAGLAFANSTEPLSMQPALSYQARAARVAWLDQVPARREQLRRLAEGTPNSPYDVLIVGGGATGTGCAVDAATRGLKVALVEREDFAAGTSSRSTKLVHGGVRYLEKAFKNLDYGQLKLVFEALHERSRLLANVPYLSSALPIMTPCYQWWEVPYYWLGLKMYDLVAWGHTLGPWSHYVSRRQSLATFPTLCAERHQDGSSLKGTIVYYDGQFNDARLAVVLACTAALAGATVLNHTEAVRLLKDGSGKVVGARVRDNMTGKEQDVYARVVLNATGPFADDIRALSCQDCSKMIMPSAGVHVTLPDYYSPEHVGMIVPKTKDGRVVFMLPWLDHTIAGTTAAPFADSKAVVYLTVTDSMTEVTMRPQPSEEEIQFILDAIADYLTVQVRRSDVMSAWSGIRPLAIDPNATNTAEALRDHIVTVDPDGLVTVTGGKWTTYRLMAEDAVDKVCSVAGLHSAPSVTATLPLLGAEGYYPALFTEVAQNYTVPHRPGAIDTRVAKYLVASYGDRAGEITKIAEQRKLGRRIVRGYPILEAEVVYAVRHEYCETPEDFVARRTRLAFLDKLACQQALPRVVELMGGELGWNRSRMKTELQQVLAYLDTFDSRRPTAATGATATAAA